MLTTDLTDAEHVQGILLLIRQSDLTLPYPWIWEEERWNELVFALLSRIIDLPDDRLRNLVEYLGDLNLLDITALSNICRDRTELDLSHSQARRILEVLQEGGASEADAQKGLVSISEAALGLKEHYSGKIQCYLRYYGELMLRELEQKFRFSILNEAEAKQAFTYWLRKVLNVPLLLADQYIESYCKENNLTPEKLVAAADQLNINVALVGDLVQHQIQRQRQKTAQTVERPTAPLSLVLQL